MLTIIKSGKVVSESHIVVLAERYNRVVIPDDQDIELTHWWVLSIEEKR